MYYWEIENKDVFRKKFAYTRFLSSLNYIMKYAIYLLKYSTNNHYYRNNHNNR